AAQGDRAEACPTTERDCLVEARSGTFRRRSIAAAIDQEERLLRIRQGNEQGMVTPSSLVGDLHSCLALTGRWGERSVGLDNRLVEERVRLTLPSPKAALVDHVHEALDRVLVEAPAEVPSGRRIRYPLRTQSVQVDLVVAKGLEIVETCPANEDVIGDVET